MPDKEEVMKGRIGFNLQYNKLSPSQDGKHGGRTELHLSLLSIRHLVHMWVGQEAER